MSRSGRRLGSFSLLSLALAGAACGQSQPAPAPAPPARARSAILFIGDGVDDSQLTIGRNYLAGADGELAFDRFPGRATAKVLTVFEDDPKAVEYVADSASGGTALSTGVVTSRGRIATRASTDEDIPTILELAERKGLRTGVVVTSSVTDATPACFVAHARIRYCEGPKDMLGTLGGLRPGCPQDLVANGGPGSIAEQIARSGIEVVLGGGFGFFDQANEAGESLLAVAAGNGYSVVRTGAELAAVDVAATAKSSGKVLGLFGASTLPTEWIGEGGKTSKPVELGPDKKPVEPEVFSCVPNPDFGTRPTLEAMTRKALELLEPAEGFFLMVESASIDKQAHAGNPCGEIGEIRALDDAVKAALEYQARHPDTLVMVASDHGHAPQIVPWPSLFAGFEAVTGRPQHPAGKVARLRTPEGGVMTISYGTNQHYLEEHTGAQVPLYAKGPGAERVAGLLRQGDVFEILRAALGL